MLGNSRFNRNRLINRMSHYRERQRRLDIALGFDDMMSVDDYDKLVRRGLGKSLRDKLPESTWLRPPLVTDGDEQSLFSQAWKLLCNNFPVWRELQVADKLLGIARYSGIFFNLQMSSEEELWHPVDWHRYKLDDIVSFTTYCENGILGKPGLSILETGKNLKDERFNKPTFYSISNGISGDSETLSRIHWSRVLLVNNSIYGDYLGEPRLEASIRTLQSIDKMNILPEAFRRSMLKYVAKAKEGFRITSESQKEFEKQIDEMRYDLRDWLRLQGFEIDTLHGNIPDPTGVWEMLRDWLAAESGIPTQVLFGTRPHQAQGSGDRQFANIVSARQLIYAEPILLKPFIKRMIRYGALPKPNGFLIIGSIDANGFRHWPPMFVQSEEQSANVMSTISQAIKTRVEAGMSLEAALISTGLNDELISQIIEKSKQADEQINKQSTYNE